MDECVHYNYTILIARGVKFNGNKKKRISALSPLTKKGA